jgi:prepilin-type N-terminal cleavage/methylation domain-containing protein
VQAQRRKAAAVGRDNQPISHARRHSGFPRPGFTLNELLIVMGLIVLILAIALPAFNLISGNRSVESAENQISAYLAIARSEAIGLQEPRGVIVFTDALSGRITLAQVYFPPNQARPEIDLFVGRDEMVVTKGVGLRGVPSVVGTQTAMENWPTYAVVMFDGDGRLLVDRYRIYGDTALARRTASSGVVSIPRPAAPNTVDPVANIGFTLFDAVTYETFKTQSAANQRTWFQDNAVPYLISRYNGGLLKGE